MVVKDGQMWRRVRSRKVRGQWYGFRDTEDEELDNMPDIFITIDGKVPKNMSGEGEDVFELWLLSIATPIGFAPIPIMTIIIR